MAFTGIVNISSEGNIGGNYLPLTWSRESVSRGNLLPSASCSEALARKALLPSRALEPPLHQNRLGWTLKSSLTAKLYKGFGRRKVKRRKPREKHADDGPGRGRGFPGPTLRGWMRFLRVRNPTHVFAASVNETASAFFCGAAP